MGKYGAGRGKKTAEAVSKTYLAGIFDRNRGFTHLRVRDIIVHLFKEYGQVEKQDLVGNRFEVVGAGGQKQNVPRIGTTCPGNSRVRERWRTDDLRQRYFLYHINSGIQHGPIL